MSACVSKTMLENLFNKDFKYHVIALTALTKVKVNLRKYFASLYPPGAALQSYFNANPGLNFNSLFWFMCFCTAVRFATLQNKASIDTENTH